MDDYTHVRVRSSDYTRIRDFIEFLNRDRRLRKFIQPDIITLALDAFEEKINKTNEKSMSNV